MSKNTAKNVGKVKRKLVNQLSDEERPGNSKKGKFFGKSGILPDQDGQRKLCSKSERKQTPKGKTFADNSISRILKNIMKKDSKKSARGVNNNAAVIVSQTAGYNDKDPRPTKSAVEEDVNSKKSALNKDVVVSGPSAGLENDGIQVQVNESDDDFDNESEMGEIDEYDNSTSDDQESDVISADEDVPSSSQNPARGKSRSIVVDPKLSEDQVRSNPEIQRIVKAMVQEELKEERMKE